MNKGQLRGRWWVGMVLAALAANVTVQAAERSNEHSSVRVQLDNDLFAGREQDRDYTGGFAVTASGPLARESVLSLASALESVDRWTSGHIDGTHSAVAHQVGVMAFTPGNITAARPLRDERPYASLLFVSNGRIRVEDDGRTAWFSSLTVGALGLSVSKHLQNAIHDAVGSPEARGYDHQISAGGEPTARYTLARQYLWIANPAGTLDVKTTVQGSVGFLTEASAALSLRYGRFDSPWWSLAPELTDYMSAPLPSARGDSRPETYLYAGLRVKARGYNAFLQGQFRASEVRHSFSAIEPIVGEAWFGVVSEIAAGTQVSYTVNYQTAELRSGSAARDTLWGAVQLTFSF
jgi:hypothetical protein